MASFHNWTGDEVIDKQVPQFLNEDNAATQEKLDAKFNKSYHLAKASDLNNIRGEGLYVCGSNNDASTMLNCPTEFAFGLMVWGTGEIVYQEVREYNRSSKNQDNNNCWRRSYYSYGTVQNAWSNWQKVAYTATTLAGYGITDGMSKDVTNSIGVQEVMKRNIDTEFLSILGGTEYNKGAIIRLYGGEASAGAGVFALRASNSSNSATFAGTPSGVLSWNNKNIVRSVNNIGALDDGNVIIPIDTALDDKSTNPVQNKVIKAALGNYYTKGNVDTLISNLKAGLVNVVGSLPTAGESGKLYLVKTGTEDKNVYTEYVYVNSAWEKLGTQKLDLSGYLTVANANNNYVRRAFSDEFNFVSESAVGDAGKLYINFRLLNADTGNSKPIKEYRFLNGLGNNLTRISAASFNGYTINASVPADAKFTDTVYTHPSTHPASMITGLATVATSGSYNDLTNKPVLEGAYKLPYGVCTTAITNKKKVATITNGVPFSLDNGSCAIIRFTDTRTGNFGQPTLNINSTGAKPVTIYNPYRGQHNEWDSYGFASLEFFIYMDGNYRALQPHGIVGSYDDYGGDS